MLLVLAQILGKYLLPTLLVLAQYEVWYTPKSGGAMQFYSKSKSKSTAQSVAKALNTAGYPAEVRNGTDDPQSPAATQTLGSATASRAGSGLSISFTSPSTLSGAVGDPTNPTVTFTIAGASSGAKLTITATSDDKDVVSSKNLVITGTGNSRTLQITPGGAGYATITVTVSDGTTTTTSKIKYAASEGGSSTTRYHTGASNASAAIAIDSNLMFVGDDESQTIRLYVRGKSGPAIASFDFTNDLGLKKDIDKDTGLPREVDIEAATRVGDRIFWVGSQSNSDSGQDRPNRNRIFATDIVGTGPNAKLVFVGRYDYLKEEIVDWDQHNGHGLGKDYLGLDKAENVGVSSKSSDGYNIEGVAMAPDGKTGYVAFRAPQIGKKKKALIVPVTNFTKLAVSGKDRGAAKFDAPILLDLGGRGIRDIVGGPDGYLILAGPAGDEGKAPDDFRLYTWSGNPKDDPVLRSANLSGLHPEAIVQLPPGPLTSSTRVQLLSDDGGEEFYDDGTASKDLTKPEFKKSRSEWVILGSKK